MSVNPYLNVFRNEEYRKFSIGYACYWMSYAFELFLVGAIVWRLTESAAIVSLVYSLEFLPSLLLGPALSTLSDKYNRISIVRLSLLAKVIKIMAVVLFLTSGHAIILILCIGSFIDGVLTAADEPALHSTIPNLVNEADISTAVSINGAVSFAALVAGPALCGFLLLNYGEVKTYSVALLFSVLYLFVWMIIPKKFGVPIHADNSNSSKISVSQQLKEAVNYLMSSGTYVYVLLIFVNALLVRSFYYTPAVQSGYFFGASVEAQTYITSAIGLGLVLGAVIAIFISKSTKLYQWSLLGLGLVIFTYFLSTVVKDIRVYICLWAIYGIGLSISLNLGKAALQAECSDEFRGRVSGFISYIPRGTAAISTPVVGFLIVQFGLDSVFYMVAAVLCLAITALVAVKRKLTANQRILKNT